MVLDANNSIVSSAMSKPDDVVVNTNIPRLFSSTTKTITNEEPKMAEVINPAGMMMSGGGGDGLFGGGGGLIGGLILGSILRNNGGGLLGGDGNGGGAGALLRSPPEQVTANMSLMQAIGAVDKSVAVNAATFEASQATQSLGITTQLSSVASALTNNLNQVNTNLMQGNALINQNVMENRYELSRDISNDGEKTRALITAQYEASLNRQLSDANANIIALQTRQQFDLATRGVEITTTNNINQMQQQSQQQAQYSQLAHLIYGLNQNITNGAINVGSGTLTANPTNTNTSIR